MISAKWDVTSTCNLRCKHCSVADLYFRGSPTENLSQAERIRVIDTLADGGVGFVSFLGGEPLTLGESFFDLLRYANRRNIRTTVVTNGQLLTRETSIRLIDAGLGALVVSIESPLPEVHNKIRGKRTFERLISNLEEFLSVRGVSSDVKLNINTVLCSVNRSTFVGIIPFCADLGADSWSALTLNYIGNASQNLDNLGLSEEDHTQVAIEVGQFLQRRPHASKLNVNFTIVCPLVWEYICSKYNITLPQPEICCSAASSLVYVAPNGDVHICDRVHSSGYIGAQLGSEQFRPMSLLRHDFVDVWNSLQYIETYDFVRRLETYKDFEPCNRCKYLHDRTCNPCPLPSLRGDKVQFAECLKAERYLGDISKHNGGERTSWEEKHILQRLIDVASYPEFYSRIKALHPQRIRGVRSCAQADGSTALLHPNSLEAIEVNLTGSAIWEIIDGIRSTEDVVDLAMRLCVEAGQALNDSFDEAAVDFLRTKVEAFLVLLVDKCFVGFDDKLSGCPASVGNILRDNIELAIQ